MTRAGTVKNFSWFRMYSEAIDDEKLRLLAFEDRWHYVAILCLKSKGILDECDTLLMRKVAVKMGLDLRSLEEVVRRLSEVGLIDEHTLQPLAWDTRQFQSDSSTERTRAWRERKNSANVSQERHGNVTVTVQDTDTDTDTEKDKKKNIAKRTATKVATPDGVPASLWNDFLAVRKMKKLAITQTALDGLQREAQKARLSLAEVLTICCQRGWGSFKASWDWSDAPKQIDQPRKTQHQLNGESTLRTMFPTMYQDQPTAIEGEVIHDTTTATRLLG